jgi:hypothetical protein
VLGDTWDICAKTAQRKSLIAPIDGEIMVEEVIIVVHSLLGNLQNVTLFVDECLAVGESVDEVDSIRSDGFHSL